MKRIYLKPGMLAAELQQHQVLASSTPEVTGISGNGGLNLGGEGNGPARVKDHNVWDEDW